MDHDPTGSSSGEREREREFLKSQLYLLLVGGVLLHLHSSMFLMEFSECCGCPTQAGSTPPTGDWVKKKKSIK